MADSTQRPPANVSRPSMPWARRIESELDQRAQDAAAIASRHASTHQTLLGVMRKMPRPGALNFRGPWEYETIVEGGTPDGPSTFKGAYMDSFDIGSVLEHSLLVDFNTGESSPATGTNVPYGKVLSVPWAATPQWAHSTGGFQGFYSMSFHVSTEWNGDPDDYPELGIMVGNQTQSSGWNQGQPGHNEQEHDGLTGQGPFANKVGSVSIGGGTRTGGLDIISFSVTALQSTLARNTYDPQAQEFPGEPGTPGNSYILGAEYKKGDLVQYNEAMWMALTDTSDGSAPSAGAWAMLAGSPADAFAGEWS